MEKKRFFEHINLTVTNVRLCYFGVSYDIAIIIDLFIKMVVRDFLLLINYATDICN